MIANHNFTVLLAWEKYLDSIWRLCYFNQVIFIFFETRIISESLRIIMPVPDQVRADGSGIQNISNPAWAGLDSGYDKILK
jgi:hypothetical protein